MAVRNAIAAHITPGASVRVDGAEAFYIQAGAMCDLAGMRLQKIDPALVDRINQSYTRDSVFTAFMAHVAAEADAVRRGRFALLKSTLRLGMRLSLQPKG